MHAEPVDVKIKQKYLMQTQRLKKHVRNLNVLKAKKQCCKSKKGNNGKYSSGSNSGFDFSKKSSCSKAEKKACAEKSDEDTEESANDDDNSDE